MLSIVKACGCHVNNIINLVFGVGNNLSSLYYTILDHICGLSFNCRTITHRSFLCTDYRFGIIDKLKIIGVVLKIARIRCTNHPLGTLTRFYVT